MCETSAKKFSLDVLTVMMAIIMITCQRMTLWCVGWGVCMITFVYIMLACYILKRATRPRPNNIFFLVADSFFEDESTNFMIMSVFIDVFYWGINDFLF